VLDVKELGIIWDFKMLKAMGDIIKHFFNEKWEENIRLKRVTRKLEAIVNHEPLLTQSFTIIGIEENLEETPKKNER